MGIVRSSGSGGIEFFSPFWILDLFWIKICEDWRLELEIKEDGIYFFFKFNNPPLNEENFSENWISILFPSSARALFWIIDRESDKIPRERESLLFFFFPPLNLDSENWIFYQRGFIFQCPVQLCGLKTD